MARKAATKFQRLRFEAMKRIGCIACRHDGDHTEPEIHHLTDCGRRMGHTYTIPLCPWHHRGVIPGMPYRPNRKFLHASSPSLAESKADFEAHYGKQVDLLAEVNELLGETA